MANCFRSNCGMFASLFLALASASCSAESRESHHGKTLIFDGTITEENVSNAINVINGPDKISRIKIRSGGGWPEPGAKLAAVIQARNIAVEVDDFCLSACMPFVFLASQSRTVENGALLGFHYADSYDVAYLSPRFGLESLTIQSRADKAIRDVYKSAGISDDMLIHQGVMLDPLCWSEMRKNKDLKSVVYKYGVWLPTSENLRSWNIEFSGSLMADSLPEGAQDEGGLSLISAKMGSIKPNDLPPMIVGGPNRFETKPKLKELDHCSKGAVDIIRH
ncbi:MAG: hypothetical protein ACOVRA_03730 [Aquidulcibacter sp.]